ncbi:hypothetical protein IM697_18090 [Streptomyces ferrugineus]|uniref:Uncharacterized protein n=1 Tax=Streptomyces ferrugineus TaxID=1413221 RepID=A0A7M2SXA9_9ACTN|nr:hypothetical protein [Streptomyces ferrugineus]QOV40138.1 hypothetical protein IM697_18090 [Streptomyces ferrugineus]
MIGPFHMTPEILARVASARAARDLSDLARQAVATTAQTASPTERIREARRLRELANQVVELVVLAEALGGASWEEITDALGRREPGTVEREFAEDVAEWGAKTEEELECAAEGHDAIDEWYARHREDQDPERPAPVADLLNRH